MADITMPQLGETVTEGTITRWLKQVGDQVAEDDVLFEVSTDKVDSEVPSPVSGFVSEILVDEGETVDVGTRLAVISNQAPGGAGLAQDLPIAEDLPVDETGGVGDVEAQEDEAAQTGANGANGKATSRLRDEDAADQAAGRGEAPGRGAVAAAGEEPGFGEEAGSEAEAAVSREAPAPSERSGAKAASGGPGGQRPPAGGPGGAGGTRPGSDRPPSGPGSGGGATSKVLSPVVRRLIAEHNLDPSQIEGTGAGGRITRDDVLALIDRMGSAAPAAAADRPAPPPAPSAGPTPAPRTPATPASTPDRPAPTSTPPAGRTAPAAKPAAAPGGPPAAAARAPAGGGEGVTAGEDDTVVPFTNIRRRTAEHMVRSKHTSAHTVVAMEVDYLAVERVRTAEKDRFKQHEGVSLNYLPFIARAVIDAIGDWPHINSSVGDDELIVHNRINLGIAVDLNYEGLLVPVIHDAADKRLPALAREIASLAERARSKRLTMDDISGGTFTLTNAGPFGTLFTIPVINQPQVAILATDGVRKKPVVVEAADGSDAIAIHPVGNLILSFDHRAVDGAYASAFMRSVKDSLETRDWSSEL